MRISDWSSDVCSSDLDEIAPVEILEVDARGRVVDERSEPRLAFANGLLGRAAPRGVPGQMVEHPVECRGQPGDFVAASDGCPVVERFRVYDRAYRRFEFAKRRREAASARSEEHTYEHQSLMRI